MSESVDGNRQNEVFDMNMNGMVMRDIDAAARVIFPGLVENLQRKKMGEGLFVNYFLPRFLNLNDINTTQPTAWIAEWISIAGTPSAEISVISDSTGEELFTVPSILQTSNLNVANKDANLETGFQLAEMMNNNIPRSGMSHLFKILETRSKSLTEGVTLSEAAQRWSAIMVRYGITSYAATPNGSPSEPEDLFESDSYPTTYVRGRVDGIF